MLKPYKIDLYVYADSDEETTALEQKLKDFINTQRLRGVAVTAKKLNEILDKYGKNNFVTNFLRNGNETTTHNF